ncbi:MAG: hypothetical protein K9J83_04180, partial [Desulfarculaceae bacterium]|nr:hypothetical protein [Desulfarculaceae bacterium]
MFKPANNPIVLFAVIFALVPVLFSGCLLNGENSNHLKSFYTFTVAPAGSVSQEPVTDGKLFVMDFTISPEYGGNSFVYKKNNRLITDYYNRFLVPPEKLIKEKCASRMDRTSIFNAVFTDNRVLPPEFILSARITELVCDISQRQTPVAAIEINFLLIRHDTSDDIILNTTVKAERTL